MKSNKNSEITKFVNSLEETVLSEREMTTLTVNPADIIGGTLTNKQNCKNSAKACSTSLNAGNCINDTIWGCGKSTNGGACQTNLL